MSGSRELSVEECPFRTKDNLGFEDSRNNSQRDVEYNHQAISVGYRKLFSQAYYTLASDKDCVSAIFIAHFLVRRSAPPAGIRPRNGAEYQAKRLRK